MGPRVKGKLAPSTLGGQSCNQARPRAAHHLGHNLLHVEQQRPGFESNPNETVNPHCHSNPDGDTIAAQEQEVERLEAEKTLFLCFFKFVQIADDRKAEKLFAQVRTSDNPLETIRCLTPASP
ncbi:hypothetical protein Landi51_13803 [Colletotrichum acutatum]